MHTCHKYLVSPFFFLSHLLLFCSWVIIIFTVIGVVIVFDPLGGKKTFYLTDSLNRNLESSQSGQLLYNVKNTATRVWEKRIRLLCCCIVQDDDHRVAFTSIAELFRTYFSVRWKAFLCSVLTNSEFADIATHMYLCSARGSCYPMP